MKQTTIKTLLWSLPFLAAILYFACMPWTELRASDEAVFATIAREMLESHNFLQPTFQGEPVSVFPLYTWLICLFSGFQTPGVFAVRLPSVLAVCAMAFAAFMTAKKHRDETCGAIAALIVLTSFGTMRIGVVGQTEILNAAFLSGAWLSWHALGPMRRKWGLAWGIALGLVLLDVLTIGMRALLLFYLPFVFTVMPPHARRLLRSKEHLLAFGTYALIFYLWGSLICPQPMFAWNSIVGPLSASAEPEGFLWHFLFFPFRCFRDLLPWGLFIWVPFCLALRPLEPHGSLCGFLRATVLCLFVCYWFMPGYSSMLMLPVLPSMAVMCSFTLPIVMKRNGRDWRKFTHSTGFVACIGLLYSLFFWIWVAAGRIVFQNCPFNARTLQIGAGVAAAMLLVFGVTVWRRSRRPECLGIAWGVAGLRVVWVSLVVLPAFLTVSDRRYVADTLLCRRPMVVQANNEDTSALEEPKALDISECSEILLQFNGQSFPAQTYYLGVPVKRLHRENLPLDKTVWVLAESQPLFPGWVWEKVSGPVDFNLHRRLTPSPAILDFWVFYWKYKGREYSRVPIADGEFPKYAREYYEPCMMNLYKGYYPGDNK